MPDARDFQWLRKTVCDEIEAVRTGKADHNRAKSVAALAIVALKSVEVEAMLREQQVGMAGKGAPELGSLPLHGNAEALAAPNLATELNLADGLTDTNDEEPAEREYGVGDRVMVASGKHGIVRKATDSGRIEVEIDGGEVLPYPAKYLSPSTKPATAKPRFVAGKVGSASR